MKWSETISIVVCPIFFSSPFFFIKVMKSTIDFSNWSHLVLEEFSSSTCGFSFSIVKFILFDNEFESAHHYWRQSRTEDKEDDDENVIIDDDMNTFWQLHRSSMRREKYDQIRLIQLISSFVERRRKKVSEEIAKQLRTSESKYQWTYRRSFFVWKHNKKIKSDFIIIVVDYWRTYVDWRLIFHGKRW